MTRTEIRTKAIENADKNGHIVEFYDETAPFVTVTIMAKCCSGGYKEWDLDNENLVLSMSCNDDDAQAVKLIERIIQRG